MNESQRTKSERLTEADVLAATFSGATNEWNRGGVPGARRERASGGQRSAKLPLHPYYVVTGNGWTLVMPP
jgi:hypothetical protein